MRSYEEICTRFPELDDISLIHESKFDSSRKTFLLNYALIKSCKIGGDNTSHLRINDLEQEFEILSCGKDIKGIPAALHFCRNNNYQIAIYSFLPGIQLSKMDLPFIKLLLVSFKLSKILFGLSIKGICHNDIVPENILITNELYVSLVDFDQAVKIGTIKAIAGNFFGIKSQESKVNYSMITIFKDYFKKKFPRMMLFVKKLLGRIEINESNKLPEIPGNAEPSLFKLIEAWRIAQISNASAPGFPLAYYAIDFKEYHFPGERPWNERWNRLKNLSGYSGKTILELGCNMGLLSIHLLKEAGAGKCISVDHDKRILESAKLISEVFEVNPIFKQTNFDSFKDWESDLLSYNIDIVFALNVLNWVNNKYRFLKFLSNFPEVIFEGHDTIEVERKRFEQIGFNTIEEIGYSERERIILRCRK